MLGQASTVLRRELASMQVTSGTKTWTSQQGNISIPGDTAFVILERVMSDDVLLREERESHYIRTFNTKYKGMNSKNLIAEQIIFKNISFELSYLQYLSIVFLSWYLSDDEDLYVFEYINRIELLMLINEKVGSSFNLSLKR